MARPSTIDKLDPKLRGLIGELRDKGHTIDEILTKLRELDVDVSRSALGRKVKQIDSIREMLKHSRDAAESIIKALGDGPENKTGRLNIE
ncbi:MAG: phage protein Gp27 family protein, partial [Phenylobacterium sp.]